MSHPPSTTLAQITRLATTLLVAITLASQANAQGRTPASVVWDVAVERPLGLVETIAGVGMAGIAYPFALPTGQTKLVVDRCITTPGRDTFARPLGDRSERPQSNCSPVAFSFGLVQLSFGVFERPLGYLFGRSPFSSPEPQPRDELEVKREGEGETGPRDATGRDDQIEI